MNTYNSPPNNYFKNIVLGLLILLTSACQDNSSQSYTQESKAEIISEQTRSSSMNFPQFDGDRWMTNLYSVLKNKKIWEIRATGSHNAFNYYGKDIGGWWATGWTYPRSIYYNHQNSPKYQFEKGVRYYDTRINIVKNRFESYHGGSAKFFRNNNIANDLIELANKVRNSKEIIILHLAQTKHQTTVNGETIVNDILSGFFKDNFDELIIKKNEVAKSLKEATIEDLLKSGNIIILSSVTGSAEFDNLYWPVSLINLDYAQKTEPATCLDAAENSIIQINKADKLDKNIKKLGYCFTPAEAGTLYVDLHQKAIVYNEYFLRHRLQDWLNKDYPFMISMDFTNDDNMNTYDISRGIYIDYIKKEFQEESRRQNALNGY